MATQAQYDAGTHAGLTYLYNAINAHVPGFFQDQAKQAADQNCPALAKLIIDAAEKSAPTTEN